MNIPSGTFANPNNGNRRTLGSNLSLDGNIEVEDALQSFELDSLIVIERVAFRRREKIK